MAKITNNISININAIEDSSQNVPINRSINFSSDSNVSEFAAYYALNTPNLTFVPIPFPGNLTIAFQIYVRNMDTAKQISLYLEPTGGGNTGPSFILNPGGTDMFLVASATGGAVNAGYIALTGNVVGGGTALMELFIGG